MAVLVPDSDHGRLGIIEHEEQHDQHEDDLVPEHGVLDGDHVPQQQLLHGPGQRGVAQDRVNLLTLGTIPLLPGVAKYDRLMHIAKVK